MGAPVRLDAEPLREQARVWCERQHVNSLRDDLSGRERSSEWVLAERVADLTGNAVYSERRYVRRLLDADAEQVDVFKADAVCVAMGLHPALVYGKEW